MRFTGGWFPERRDGSREKFVGGCAALPFVVEFAGAVGGEVLLNHERGVLDAAFVPVEVR
jgi:hypothetical protein